MIGGGSPSSPHRAAWTPRHLCRTAGCVNSNARSLRRQGVNLRRSGDGRPRTSGSIGHDPPPCSSPSSYQVVRYLTDLTLVRTQSDAQLRAEVLALRHQLRVLERKVGKPAWQPGDRLLLAALRRLLRRSSLDALLPRPETLPAGTASWSVASGPPLPDAHHGQVLLGIASDGCWS